MNTTVKVDFYLDILRLAEVGLEREIYLEFKKDNEMTSPVLEQRIVYLESLKNNLDNVRSEIVLHTPIIDYDDIPF